MTPYREQKNEATRRERSHKKHEKGENDIKDEQVEKGLGTNALRSERNPQSDKNTKKLKPKFAPKTALEKSLTKQNKNKQTARNR